MQGRFRFAVFASTDRSRTAPTGKTGRRLLLLELLLGLLETLRLALLAGVARGRSDLGNDNEETTRSTHVRSLLMRISAIRR